jgi:PPOX class probable F420-dependent enzyme
LQPPRFAAAPPAATVREQALKLPPEEARRRFAAAPVARLATVGSSGAPHLVPITFAVAGGVIYTAVDTKPKTTPDLKRLRNIAASPRVAVLADHYSGDWDELWWARADGEAVILGAPAEVAGPLRLLAGRFPHYAAHPPAGPVFAIRVTLWSGWAARP